MDKMYFERDKKLLANRLMSTKETLIIFIKDYRITDKAILGLFTEIKKVREKLKEL